MTSGDAKQLLRAFVDDWNESPESAQAPTRFGIRIKGLGDWHVIIDEKGKAELHLGFPPEAIPFYSTDSVTLEKIFNGEFNALTAMGKAEASDSAPMEIEFCEGFQPDENFFTGFIPLSFHFWTRGRPEVVSFGKEHSRVVHGANATVLYYQKGLRTAWYSIDKGQHINRDETDQVNPFPSLFVITCGKCEARIGGKRIQLVSGQTVMVPPGVSHEFWNENEGSAELIVIMFGDGA